MKVFLDELKCDNVDMFEKFKDIGVFIMFFVKRMNCGFIFFGVFGRILLNSFIENVDMRYSLGMDDMVK